MTSMNNIIKERRKALGITQRELADTLSISDKTVSRWESGNQIPDAILLPDLAEALNISINQLYGFKEEAKEETEPVCLKAENKKAELLNIAYKISIAVGLVLFLFGSMLMIHINDIYYFMPDENDWANGNVFMFIGAGLCIASQVAFMLLSRFKFSIFDKSEIIYGGICALSVMAVLQIVFPLFITVHITYAYEIIVGLFAVAVTLMMIFQKKTLRNRGVKVGKGITIASIAVVTLCVLIMLGVFIYLTFFSEKAKLDELLVMFGGIGQKESFGYRFLQFSFYAVQLPLISAVFMNFIHLLVKSRKL